MNDNEEKQEKTSYFDSFLRDVIRDLEHNKSSYVFTNEQLEYLKKRYDIEVTKQDECCIYIKLRKE